MLQALSNFFDSSDFYDSCDFFARPDDYARDDLFFGREIEQSLLLAQPRRSPTSVLVLVGPHDSGKTRLLREVLTRKKEHKGLVTFVDGRYGLMTDASETAVLRRQGARQLAELKHMIKTSGKAAEAAVKPGVLNMIKSLLGVKVDPLALLPSSVLKTLGGYSPCSIHDVITAYNSVFRLSSSTRISESSPLPVICIDEANVLMGWHKHGAAMQGDLDALLRFFVKVRVPLLCMMCCCQRVPCVLCCFAGEQGGPPGACDTCRFGGQLHYLADRE